MDSCDELKQWVMEASIREDVRERVRGLYGELQERIDERKPVCVMSGRCCRFDEFGHRLYVTTAELGVFVGELREFDPGFNGAEGVKGGCVFQSGKICRVHRIRPLGCRLFFCDSTAMEWQRGVYEEFQGRLKRIHEEMSIPYVYVEWRVGCRAVGLEL